MGHPDLLNFVLSDADDTRAKSLEKSPNALRTISEAAELLDVPQHVLRFWETKFSQIKPLKRNGGRRYYRPSDIDVLQQIKFLLYRQGYTIKGAKKAIDDLLVSGANAVHWAESFPPANGNDNFVSESQIAPEFDAKFDADLHSTMLQETSDESAPSHDASVNQDRKQSLLSLRDELLSLREALTPFM